MRRRRRPKIFATIIATFFVCLKLFDTAAGSASSSWNASYDVTRDAALAVAVRPPSRGPRFLKRMAWGMEKRLLQFIGWFDPCSPPDSKLSLRVLWWKAIAAADRTSPVYEQDGLTYDMLPSGFRWLVRDVQEPLRSILHPRWVHVIIEIRTAYLDQAIKRIRNETKSSTKLRLILMGGGYDARSIRLQLNGVIDEAVELDLPEVIEAKQKLLERLCKRRPNQNINLPTFHAIDLRDTDNVRRTLVGILNKHDDGGNRRQQQWYNIFLFEGVLMYLPEGDPCKLLQACRRALEDAKQKAASSLRMHWRTLMMT